MSDQSPPEPLGLTEYLAPNSMASPLIVRGIGAEVEDDGGQRYLDLEAGPGVASVGHCHPGVVKAVREQVERLIHPPGRNHTPLTLRLAKRLSDLTGGRLRRTFFANSGAEANDGAVKLGLKHAVTKGKSGLGIIALEHGFHGRLSLPLALTGMAARKKGFGPYASFPGVVHAPAPYCYRCPLNLSRPDCGFGCVDALEERLKTSVPGEAALMVAEPILGVGGIIVPPEEYWPRVQAVCRRNGITLIHDEVFTGFGRTGKMFAHQHWDARPDVVTFAKAIAGGVPLGGFIATEEVGTAFETGDHFTTFGANNQLGMASAHAVLDILQAEKLPEHAGALGARFLAGLRDLQGRYEAIGDVRGRGLMLGVELVRDRESRAPAPDLAKAVQGELRKRGVLVSVTGVHGCVLRLTPPLVITEAQVELALRQLELSLAGAIAASGTGGGE
jgi:4-aminobutyrate aminotransferase-like enzyme